MEINSASKHSVGKFTKSLYKWWSSTPSFIQTKKKGWKGSSCSDLVTELPRLKAGRHRIPRIRATRSPYQIRECREERLTSKGLAITGIRSQLWKYQWAIWHSWRKDAFRQFHPDSEPCEQQAQTQTPLTGFGIFFSCIIGNHRPVWADDCSGLGGVGGLELLERASNLMEKVRVEQREEGAGGRSGRGKRNQVFLVKPGFDGLHIFETPP